MIGSVRSAPRVAAVAPALRASPATAAVRPFVAEVVPVNVREVASVRAAAAAADAVAVPAGLNKYETLIILKPTLSDEERDQELARFESFLHQEGCQSVKAMVRGRQRMAYPVKGNWEGIYVLFQFNAQPSTAPKVQKLLSTPVAGAEDNILRHMTFNY